MSRISSQRNRGYSSHDFGLWLHKEILIAYFCNGSIACSHQQVAIWQQVDAVDALWEELLGWADSLEVALGQRDLNHVTCLCSQVGILILRVNDAATENSLQVTHVHISVLNFLVDEVCVPDLDAIVVDGQQLAVRGVKESYLVRCVSAYWISTQSFTSCNLN